MLWYYYMYPLTRRRCHDGNTSLTKRNNYTRNSDRCSQKISFSCLKTISAMISVYDKNLKLVLTHPVS